MTDLNSDWPKKRRMHCRRGLTDSVSQGIDDVTVGKGFEIIFFLMDGLET
jgi:hypothetical protein